MYYKSDKYVSKLRKAKIIQSQSVSNYNMQLNEELYRVLIQSSNDVFEIIKPDGTIVYMNDVSEKIMGYKQKERLGKKIFDYYKGNEYQKIKRMVEFVLENPDKKAEGDLIFKTSSGKMVYLEVHMQNLLNETSIEGIAINCRDTTKRVNMEKQMAHISTHDELTGLPNLIYFRKKLRLQCTHAKKTKTKFAVMMLDIIGFRNFNNTLGYQFGDQLIVKVAEKLKSYLNEEQFLCRYSGDRFIMIVQSSSTVDEYKNVAKGMINLFDQNTRVGKYEIDINISIGISIYNKDENIDKIIKQAEMSLVWAKKQGKNKYKFYSSDINIQNYKQFELRNDLRKALENDELRVYYQPIINLKNNEILAAETLIRWEHPDWGMVPPGEFISLAEETGLIINIGYWLFREVCRNYQLWLNEGLPDIKVSVNISSIQFFENNFVQNIIDILNEFDLDSNFLIFEITESIFMLKVNNVISNFEKLQSYGIQIAIDDFGTGFSSLSYFNHFKIDILKIDGSFIKSAISDKTSGIITKYIIDLAERLNIKLIAEGIEKLEQLNYLKELNCYAGQGYIFKKPLPTEEFKEVLSSKRCEPLDINKDFAGYEDRRKFFRYDFQNLLVVNMTIKEFRGQNLSIGNTKVLVKNISLGGLCFISNIKIPVNKEIVLKFIINIDRKELSTYGHPIWSHEIDNNLYEYGIRFKNNENQSLLMEKLNKTMITNNMFSDMIISCSPDVYFKIGDSSF